MIDLKDRDDLLAECLAHPADLGPRKNLVSWLQANGFGDRRILLTALVVTGEWVCNPYQIEWEFDLNHVIRKLEEVESDDAKCAMLEVWMPTNEPRLRASIIFRHRNKEPPS